MSHRSKRLPASSRRNVESVRHAAWNVLQRVVADEAYVGRVVSEPDVGAADRRKVLEIVAGVTRWRRYLDFLIDRFTRRVEPGLRLVLQIGIYDMLMMRTPSHAAVNEAVELAKTVVRPAAASFVNGVLREIDRRREKLPEPDGGDPVDDLAVTYSHPTWLVRRWMERWGEEDTRRLLEWNNQRPVHTVRPNPLKLSVEDAGALLRSVEIPFDRGRFLDDALRLVALQQLREHGFLREGLFAVQDEAAMLVVRLLDPQPGEAILDLCAAPGGKSLYAAAQMGNRGRVVAVDVHEARLRLLQTASRRHGVSIIETDAGDARTWRPGAGNGTFDAVLVDAPCLGTGVLAKRADARWRKSPERLRELVALQQQILAAARRFVRPGGRLVYATCSIEPEENEEQVKRFLAANPDFELQTPDLARWGLNGEMWHYLAVLPFRHGIDGAFAAVLRLAD